MNNQHNTSGLSILKPTLFDRHWWIPLAIAEALVLCLAIALTLWAHPLNDDFGRAVRANEFGFPECIIREYFRWTGRWSGIGLVYAVTTVFDLTHVYKICLLISFFLYVMAGHFFITSVLQSRAQRLLSWGLALSLFSLYWTGMPHPGETFYWLTGTSEHHLSIALWMFIFGASIRLGGPLTKRLGLYAFGLAALTFFAMGMHELFGAMALVVLIVTAIIAMYTGHPQRHVWLIVATGAVIGFLVVYMAPGNEERMAWNARHGFPVGDLRWSLFLTGWYFFKHLAQWIVDPKLLAATTLFIAALPASRLKPTWLETAGVPLKPIIPAVWLTLQALGCFGPAWGCGNCGVPRTFNGIYMVFLLGWFLTVFVYSRWDPRKIGTNQPRARLWLAACGIILAAGLLQGDNTRKAILDIRWKRVQDYDQVMKQRYKLVRESLASGQMSVKVPAITAWPESYLQAPMSSDARLHWNRMFARYFGLKEVASVPPDDP